MKQDATIDEGLRSSAKAEQSDRPCETAILAVLTAGAMSAQDIAQITGLPPSRLNPSLGRLVRAGSAASRWAEELYPQRRMYWVCAEQKPDAVE